MLCIASRLLAGCPAGSEWPEAVIDTLSLEPRLRIATRLALLRLSLADTAFRPGASMRELASMAGELDALIDQGHAAGLAGLIDLAPSLQILHRKLASEGNPLAVVPVALLELMRSQLH